MGGKPTGESCVAGALTCPAAAVGSGLNGLMLCLLIDENFNQRILRGLLLGMSGLDYVIDQETAMQGMQDPPLLRKAAALHRILVTQDLKPVPRHAYARVAAGEPMPGIIAVPDDLPIGQAIEQLYIVVECAEENDLENQVLYLPLCEAEENACLAVPQSSA